MFDDTLGTISALTPLNLLLSILFLVLVSFVVDHLRNPRALGTRPRPDLYSPPGAQAFIGDFLRAFRNADRQPERAFSDSLLSVSKTLTPLSPVVWLEMELERRRAGAGPTMARTSTMFGRRFIALSRPEHLQHMQMVRPPDLVPLYSRCTD